jgi:nucleotide-binding universal stress UspA family protein
MQKIMIATDFSERSDRALRRATLLAKEAGASLTIVHVVDDDRPRRIVEHDRKDAETLLRELQATVQRVDGLACEARVILADPFAGIIQATAEAAPDLLVIGPHRRQFLRDAFVGTTAERTIRSVACPALMVNAAPVGPYHHVLQTTDCSEGSRAAMQRFAGLKFGSHAVHSVLHVFDAPALRLSLAHSMSRDDQEEYVHQERTTAESALAQFLASCGIRDTAQFVRHDETTTANEILKAATELKADLIVVSTRGKGGLARMVLGSVAEKVLRSSPVDVLAIPPERAQ